jgi:hypothetical protein
LDKKKEAGPKTESKQEVGVERFPLKSTLRFASFAPPSPPLSPPSTWSLGAEPSQALETELAALSAAGPAAEPAAEQEQPKKSKRLPATIHLKDVKKPRVSIKAETPIEEPLDEKEQPSIRLTKSSWSCLSNSFLLSGIRNRQAEQFANPTPGGFNLTSGLSWIVGVSGEFGL